MNSINNIKIFNNQFYNAIINNDFNMVENMINNGFNVNQKYKSTKKFINEIKIYYCNFNKKTNKALSFIFISLFNIYNIKPYFNKNIIENYLNIFKLIFNNTNIENMKIFLPDNCYNPTDIFYYTILLFNNITDTNIYNYKCNNIYSYPSNNYKIDNIDNIYLDIKHKLIDILFNNKNISKYFINQIYITFTNFHAYTLLNLSICIKDEFIFNKLLDNNININYMYGNYTSLIMLINLIDIWFIKLDNEEYTIDLHDEYLHNNIYLKMYYKLLNHSNIDIEKHEKLIYLYIDEHFNYPNLKDKKIFCDKIFEINSNVKSASKISYLSSNLLN